MKLCTFPGCGRPLQAQGLCSGHRSQRYEGRELKPLRAKLPDGTYKFCTFAGCNRAHVARGYCSTHWHQAKKGTDMFPVGGAEEFKAKRPEVKLAQIFARSVRNGECLEYAVNQARVKKYASVGWNGTSIGVHRLVYMLHYGEDISGAVIHHMCGNGACVNPEHLQRAHAAENTLEMLARRDYEAEIARLQLRIVELEAELERAKACG